MIIKLLLTWSGWCVRAAAPRPLAVCLLGTARPGSCLQRREPPCDWGGAEVWAEGGVTGAAAASQWGVTGMWRRPVHGFSGEKEGVLRMPILPNVLMGVGGVSGVEAWSRQSLDLIRSR